jgi:hypothetical protein
MKDLDGDLDVDCVVSNLLKASISVLVNNGGTFASPVTYETGERPKSVALGDMDDDHDLDIAAANSGSDNVTILLNNGDATFGDGVEYHVGDEPVSLALGDLDGDHDLDVAVANTDDDNVSILLNNGDGTYSVDNDYDTGNRPNWVALGDLDGDDDLDIAVANSFAVSVLVLLNNGDGTFLPGFLDETGDWTSVAIADLDGDLDLDLALTNDMTHSVSILLNNGDATFAGFKAFETGPVPRAIQASDLDGDLDRDLVVATGYVASILLNNGNGTFQTAHYVAGSGLSSIAIVDFDGDIDRDLVLTNSSGQTISLLTNDCDASFILPEKVTVVRGLNIGGDVNDLFFSDDSYLKIRPTITPAPPPIWLEITAVSPIQTASAIDFVLETNGNTVNLVQSIEAFNFESGQFEFVQADVASLRDTAIRVSLNGDPSRFIQVGTGQMKMKLTWRAFGIVFYFPWTVSIDHAQWSVTE